MSCWLLAWLHASGLLVLCNCGRSVHRHWLLVGTCTLVRECVLCCAVVVVAAVYVDELRRREKELGVEPDPEVDAFLKAEAVEGKRSNIVTDLILRVLGLEVRFGADSCGRLDALTDRMGQRFAALHALLGARQHITYVLPPG